MTVCALLPSLLLVLSREKKEPHYKYFFEAMSKEVEQFEAKLFP